MVECLSLYKLIPISIDQKVGVLVWTSLVGVLLSGTHRRNSAAPGGTHTAAGWKEPQDRARLDRVSLPTLLYPYQRQTQTANDRLGPADLSLIGPHPS